jgi:hypothetical protein
MSWANAMANLLTNLENLWAQLQGLLAKPMSQLGVGGNVVPKLLLAGLMLLAVGTLLLVIFINLRIGARTRARSRDVRQAAPARYNPSPAIEELRALTARQPALRTPAEPDTHTGTDFLTPSALEEHHELPLNRDAEALPLAEINPGAEPENAGGPVEQHHEALREEPANASRPQADTNAEVQLEALANAVEERCDSELVEPTDVPSKAENSVDVQLENAASLVALVRQLHDTMLSQKATIEELRGIVARHSAPSAAASSSAGSNGSGDSRLGSGSEVLDKFEEQPVLLHNEMGPNSQTEPV